jgi:hypothetical protein
LTHGSRTEQGLGTSCRQWALKQAELGAVEDYAEGFSRTRRDQNNIYTFPQIGAIRGISHPNCPCAPINYFPFVLARDLQHYRKNVRFMKIVLDIELERD